MVKNGSLNRLKKLLILTIGGAAIFWVTTIVTSLLPLAAEYRAAYSNWSIQTVWVDSLLVGLIFGGCISYALLRSLEKRPTADPMQRSVIFSGIALAIVIIMIDVPQSFLQPGSTEVWKYFFIGVMFNAVRFLLIGAAVGFLYKGLYGPSNFMYAFKGDK